MYPDRSLVHHQQQFVVWHHPKCASTTVKSWFCAAMGDESVWQDGRRVHGQSIHDWVSQYPHAYPEQPYPDYFHFTVVRHPLARLASHYRQQVQSPDGPAYTLRPRMSAGDQIFDTFRDFCEIVLFTDPSDLDPHCAPICPALQGVTLDRVLYTDTMNATWSSLPITPNPVLPGTGSRPTEPARCCVDWPSGRFRETEARPPWTCYYDAALRSDMEDYFREDIARFFS